MKHLSILLFLFIIINTSCSNYFLPRDCNKLVLLDIQNSFSNPITINNLIIRLVKEYNLSRENINVNKDQNFLEWQKYNIYYKIYIKDEMIHSIHIEYKKYQPTANMIIHCIGKPDKYSAVFSADVEAYKLTLDLLFYSENIWASGYIFWRKIPEELPKLNENTPIHVLNIVDPTRSLEDVFWSLNQKPFKSWPDDWQQTEIEIDTNTLLNKNLWKGE